MLVMPARAGELFPIHGHIEAVVAKNGRISANLLPLAIVKPGTRRGVQPAYRRQHPPTEALCW